MEGGEHSCSVYRLVILSEVILLQKAYTVPTLTVHTFFFSEVIYLFFLLSLSHSCVKCLTDP